MSDITKPLHSEDFPVHSRGRQAQEAGGTLIATARILAMAADVASRFNEDECRREEDKWSA